jgi:hypothetical protein
VPKVPHIRVAALNSLDDLKAQAQQKRDIAADLRRIAPSISMPPDRASLDHHAEELEADATRLDAKAVRYTGTARS